MYQLGVNAACTYVRTILDELLSVDEIDMLADIDSLDLHKLVENSIVEAVVRVHGGALPVLVDGIEGAKDTDYSAELSTEDGTITIKMLKDTLRVASIKVANSPVVCEYLAEDSTEGRKQLNKFVRGVSDDPRIVLAKKWGGEYKPVFTFYSTTATELPEIVLEYVPYPVIEESMVSISPRLEYAVLNEIAAMVLDSLNEHNKAALYRAKSTAMMEGK